MDKAAAVAAQQSTLKLYYIPRKKHYKYHVTTTNERTNERTEKRRREKPSYTLENKENSARFVASEHEKGENNNN